MARSMKISSALVFTLVALHWTAEFSTSVNAWTSCTKQSDCEEDECCLDNLFFKRPYCEKRYPPGGKCSNIAIYRSNDLYYLTCPCVRLYDCKQNSSLLLPPTCVLDK